MPIYETIPAFGQLVEFITQANPTIDENGERHYGVVINSIDFVDQPIVEAAESLLADYEKVEVLRAIPEVPAEDIPVVQVKIEEVFHSDVAKLATVTANPKEIVSSLVVAKSYPDWVPDLVVKIGDVLRYPVDKNLYQVVQGHTTQSDYTPIVAKSLFKRYYEPDDDPWPWVQPVGAHDAYPKNAKALFNGDIWQSTIDANVWPPGVTGWVNLSKPLPAILPWVQPTGAHDVYNTGNQVTFNGHLWESLIDANVWSPTVYPAGWRDLGVYP
jgi:hypothetical protein